MSREHDPMLYAAQLRYAACMKTATIPSVRVEPEFRAEVEAVLGEGETLSEFVDADVVVEALQRKLDAARAKQAKTRR